MPKFSSLSFCSNSSVLVYLLYVILYVLSWIYLGIFALVMVSKKTAFLYYHKCHCQSVNQSKLFNLLVSSLIWNELRRFLDIITMERNILFNTHFVENFHLHIVPFSMNFSYVFQITAFLLFDYFFVIPFIIFILKLIV